LPAFVHYLVAGQSRKTPRLDGLSADGLAFANPALLFQSQAAGVSYANR
jgi:hypothetical protein